MVIEGEYYSGPCKLLELPHDVLNILFLYLDATSLYNLSRTCNYLKEFILHPLFWKYIDARDEPNSLHKIEYCTRRLHKKTAYLFLRGNLTVSDLPVNFFKTIKSFENIRVLALENVKIRGSKVTLRDFPSGLEELSLRRTYVTNSEYFFQHSVKNIPKLRVLILDECVWVTCSFLLSVSKYEHLEIISIVKCLRVHLNMIPYLSVAKLGCKNLKIFDCRFTAIGCELLRTFYSKENLQRLYFQSFKSAEFDYDENIFDYSSSGRKSSVPEPNSDFSIADIHLCEYMTTTAKPKNEVAKIKNSVLYRDPYPECKCGGEGGTESLRSSVIFPEVDIMHMPSGAEEQKFLCRKHMKNVTKLPSKVKAFFLSQQKFDPDIHSDQESTSDEEEDDNCCYFGMGNSLIVPTAHDRTPSVGEEMTLPEEGARNLHFPRVVEHVDVLEDIRDCAGNSPGTSRHGARGSSLDYRNLKRSHRDNDEDANFDLGQIKKAKKNNTPFDGLTNEAREALVNDLVESIDDVNSRIQKIVRAGSSTIHTRNTQTRSQTECQPSTSRSINGVSHPNNETPPASSSSTITISHDFINRPSCSTIKINRNGNDAPPKAEESTGRNRITENPTSANKKVIGSFRDFSIKIMRIFSRDDIPNNQDRWKVKWKIPLRRLSLRGYRNISDSTLSHLKNLDIELIDLTYTSVTKVGIDNFLVHNPNCRVIHPLYCVCKPKFTLF